MFGWVPELESQPQVYEALMKGSSGSLPDLSAIFTPVRILDLFLAEG